ncbi:MAG TPA: class I SAM-dependent methyltransferase, partial [Ktedonobacteraceae bacterium]|nr:class I SAM-dependent methyltransferase [Ktedonobacteraceae bacterium]
MTQDFYTSGEYLQENPTWHADESPWKVAGVLGILKKRRLQPKTIGEIGCGAGEVLRLLQQHLAADCELWGYDISPKAIELCSSKANERLHFVLADRAQAADRRFDLILILDVLEHLEDYFSLLREIHPTSDYKIFQLPMDISLRSVFLKRLTSFHKTYGHLHYFTKETALQMVRDAGYEVVDFCYNGPTGMVPLPWEQVKSRPLLFPRLLLRLVKRIVWKLSF